MKESNQSLVTGGQLDPFLPQLLDAINQATEIDITVAFIRQSGLQLIFDALRDAMSRRAVIRVLTSDYLDVTEPQALRRLMLLAERGADVRIFSTPGDPSFHIKSYIFLRRDGDDLFDGCAFVGSSNISNMALTRGLEWNLRVDYPADSAKFQEIFYKFEALFSDSRLFPLTHVWIDDYAVRRKVSLRVVSGEPEEEPLPATPTEIQAEALFALQATRIAGYRRGLVVLATGLGKTWLAAFDVQQIKAKRVLFVAHREEILMQAEDTFARIQPETSLGYYTGRAKDGEADFVFASIQSLGRDEHLRQFAPDCFDYIVVDEFHHADSITYRRLINYFQPGFMLGLTATPERTDQADILSLCDDNLVFERNFVEGINADLLCPFHYHGIHDRTVEYTEIPWRNGRFDPRDLSNQLATYARAKHALTVWRELSQSRTLAFCVSRSHAEFMADYFKKEGILAAAVHAESELPRHAALNQLESGKLEVIFSVDLFNEGTDLPSIDTVMMLRPTESKILFLQQLGRGLRMHDGKDYLQVLDFIGNHKAFLNKPETLFGVTSLREFIRRQLQDDLPLPKGCFANYDLGVIDFLNEVIKTLPKGIVEIYEQLMLVEQQRPSAVEMYRAGVDFKHIRRNKKFGSWFDLVTARGGLDDAQQRVLQGHRSYFLEVEKAAMNKSYKMVLLEALLELDGFIHPQTIQDLAIRSGEILLRRQPLMVMDLPKRFQNLAEVLVSKFGQWLTYWNSNPVNAFIGGNNNQSPPFFEMNEDRLQPNFELAVEDRQIFHAMVQELADYKLAMYMDREQRNADIVAETGHVTRIDTDDDWDVIPFYPNLKIACGHFNDADGGNETVVKIAPQYRANSSRHFIARATGNSMDGGRSPIRDGDYLLLKLVDTEHAGSISNQIMAVERQDVSGDDQYVLRVVRKRGDGGYYLQANNPDYADFDAAEGMRPFARLCKTVASEEVVKV
ncbi:MAG: helicase [Gammaproteobacteria bacterium (ex Lamellibrachia satsuma)]|nr:MAG: DEAD/DEAH box helicase family protein [Gammaproteobacteria bacterium (ex Lamellibrachia satsuma)]RRS32981.1 MAG: helicase [Gammaproteobacteria bacterium (ex Lamellibrachia satsuma)]RRS36634.1 MAG: helicase [Gammaproteobacteria bacterium (ex Lamellibrachia satsuma)]